MTFICYPKCSTCQKAKLFLEENNISYTERHIKQEKASYDELKVWHEKSGLPIKKFYSTSGILYRTMKLADKLPTMTDEEKIELLASDGMLVRRPLLISEDFVLAGFNEDEWREKLLD